MDSATDKKRVKNSDGKQVAKKTAKKAAAKKKPVAKDPREHLKPTSANFKGTLTELREVLTRLPAPAEPVPGDLIDACMHIIFAEGIPCGFGQEALRRIEREYVDRNEFRLTEAFETAELLSDLGIPDLFNRCRTVQRSVGEIYNDQNSVSLEGLREAVVSERKSFFQRVPALPARVVHYLNDIMSLDELCFSQRSTQRVQLRLGFDPKSSAVTGFVSELREIMAPYGHMPLLVGADTGNGMPLLEPILSPACLLQRLAKPGKK